MNALTGAGFDPFTTSQMRSPLVLVVIDVLLIEKAGMSTGG
jgi:hypothetical protein